MKVLRLDDNYLSFNIRSLTVFGVWNPYTGENKFGPLYTYYAFGLFLFAGMTQTIAKVIHAWRDRRNIVKFTQHFTIVIGMASTMVKVVNLWHRKSDVEKLIDLLNYERRQPCDRKFAIYREKIVTRTIRACKSFSLIFLIMVFWYALFIYGRLLVYYKGNSDMLPLSSLFPLRSNRTYSYWLLYTYDQATFFYIAGTVASHDSLFMVFLIHLGVQLDLLRKRLQHCHDKPANEHHHEEFIKKVEDPDTWTIECVRRNSIEEKLLNPLAELHAAIEHHQQILRYVSLVQSIFQHTLLLQFASSLIMITMIVFQIAGEAQLTKNEFIEYVTLLLCAMLQLLLYCWFGTDIIAKSESISLSAYRSKWYTADERFKKTLNIFMCRGQDPITIRVGYVSELSSITFMNIISKCYSSVTLLNRVNQ